MIAVSLSVSTHFFLISLNQFLCDAKRDIAFVGLRNSIASPDYVLSSVYCLEHFGVWYLTHAQLKKSATHYAAVSA